MSKTLKLRWRGEGKTWKEVDEGEMSYPRDTYSILIRYLVPELSN